MPRHSSSARRRRSCRRTSSSPTPRSATRWASTPCRPTTRAAGIALLGADEAAPLQARLRRNLARALVKLGDAGGARAALAAGIEAARRVDDPKLVAELHLESARLAYQSGDGEAQRRHTGEVLALADRLRNSQLYGQAREALGMAAQQSGDRAEARRQFEAARASFNELGLERDELRASQSLIGLSLDLGVSLPRLDPLLRRYVDLQGKVALSDRSQAADDFETRLRYAKQQMDVARLESEARLAAERAEAFAAQRTLGLVALLLAALVATVLAVSFLMQRRSNRLLESALREQQRSESQAGELLRLSPGLVMLHDLDGRLLRVNPAAARALGVGGRERHAGFARRRRARDGDHQRLSGYLAELRRGGAASVELHFADGAGERLLRLDGRVAGRSSDVVGHAVDITEDAREAEALREQALIDPLTGCPNRRFLAQFAAALAPDAALGVVNIDLDGFKHWSMIASATTKATACCAKSPGTCGRGCAKATICCASAATSSSRCCRKPMQVQLERIVGASGRGCRRPRPAPTRSALRSARRTRRWNPCWPAPMRRCTRRRRARRGADYVGRRES
jgi:PAS domain-containing protein